MVKKKNLPITIRIEPHIFTIRGKRVIIDSELAGLYGVKTKRLNEQVKRNAVRFPEDFVFQLNPEEAKALRSQFATSNGRGGRRYAPYAFTEHGAIMAANVLNSYRAIEMSVFVVRAFIKMRYTYIQNKKLTAIFTEVEKKLTSRLDVHEKAILHLITEMKKLTSSPTVIPEPKKKRKMGFGPPCKKSSKK